MKINTKKDRRQRIGLRQRKRIAGTPERPRLRVFRSVSHIYAQVIDDMNGTTLASAASTEPSSCRRIPVAPGVELLVDERHPALRRPDAATALVAGLRASLEGLLRPE